MELQQQHEWQRFREHAVDHLRSFAHVDTTKYRPAAQFLILPSFSDTRSIDILQQDNTLLAFHTVWRTTTDLPRFANPVERLKHLPQPIPTYESVPLNIGEPTLQHLLSAIGEVDLTSSPTANTASLDGTSYELYAGPETDSKRLRWHSTLPPEWKSLHPICEKFLAMERESELYAE
ncbi:hypothetical protein [Aeoliella mucimassa]|uniref:Uncharacterized protein n=1 Tax=Aeoliella mucimassa TaxID=2527972 RepID=A0A518AI03_9BACT|nr:hypothetical protein [Aeoliella mucimassa]QDU54358.1 hypothetical protein Pan181_05390 [Aeoliella mucimassa]